MKDHQDMILPQASFQNQFRFHLMFEIYSFSGVAGMLKSVIVSKEWRDTLYEKTWDVLLWKAVYLREAEGGNIGDNGPAAAVGSGSSNAIPVASAVVPLAVRTASETPPVAFSVEEKTTALGSSIDGGRSSCWRTVAANWFVDKEAKRLREVRKKFRDKERGKLGDDGQNDTLILLR